MRFEHDFTPPKTQLDGLFLCYFFQELKTLESDKTHKKELCKKNIDTSFVETKYYYQPLLEDSLEDKIQAIEIVSQLS